MSIFATRGHKSFRKMFIHELIVQIRLKGLDIRILHKTQDKLTSFR